MKKKLEQSGKRYTNAEVVYDVLGRHTGIYSEDFPKEQVKITYPHPNKPGELTSQNYVVYPDLAVVIPIRLKDVRKGWEFALVEKEAPAFICDEGNEEMKGYTGIFLEAPSFALPENENQNENKDTRQWLKEKVTSIGLEMLEVIKLDESGTPICQSFTNQRANFYALITYETEVDHESKLHWFPISTLNSYLEMQRWGGEDGLHSSIQTLYALEQLRLNSKLKKRTTFNLDRPLPELHRCGDVKVENPSYRFNIKSVAFARSDDTQNVKEGVYLTSRSNAGNCILVTKDKKRIYLSKQQRSPFLKTENAMMLEVAGGLNEGRSYEKAAIAELSEEQGFMAETVKEFTGPLAATPLNSELSQAFMAYYEQGKEGKQNLDEQEKIGVKQSISVREIYKSLKERDDIPLTTKYYVLLLMKDTVSDFER